MKSIMHTTKISIAEKNRIELVAILNTSLASTADLYAQLKQAHWNVKGPNFIGLHKLLDELAEQIEEHVDIIAERITSLGGTALGTIQATHENTELRVYPTNIFSWEDHIEHLTHNIAILGELSRTNIEKTEELEDMATSDFYIALTQVLDKSLWFLEAHRQK
ncbi:MAG: DNA starvation/stationary phase protection protein Dps [Candidatus Dependentiae bacterium]|nr:DNA starvation/stationary phase protection protein Dps [Candidatus Dependentiae bacterium]